MTDPADFDWSKSENFERGLLFKAFDALFRAGRSRRDVVEQALGGKTVTDAYVDNFRQGKNSRDHAVELFKYLRSHDPAAAQELMRQLQPRAQSPWANYYKKKRSDGLLAVAPYVDHASPMFRDPPGITRLHTNDPFYLQLDSHIDGYAIGLWADLSHWFKLGIGPTAVTKGRQWITRDQRREDDITNLIFGGPVGTDEVRPMMFKGTFRYPEFVIIVSDENTSSQMMNAIHSGDIAIDGRALDRMLAILETSKRHWFIAWANPSFVPPV